MANNEISGSGNRGNFDKAGTKAPLQNKTLEYDDITIFTVEHLGETTDADKFRYNGKVKQSADDSFEIQKEDPDAVVWAHKTPILESGKYIVYGKPITNTDVLREEEGTISVSQYSDMMGESFNHYNVGVNPGITEYIYDRDIAVDKATDTYNTSNNLEVASQAFANTKFLGVRNMVPRS